MAENGTNGTQSRGVVSERRTTLPLAALVEDYTIYPRHAVDEGHVSRLVQSLRSGSSLPPLVVEAATGRLVDGFHRSRALRRVLGAEGTAEVIERRYASPAALLEDAVLLNARHGRTLDRIDQVRVVAMLEEVGVPPERVAYVLSVPADRLERLRVRVAITPAGESLPLKRPALHLAGETLTADQVRAHARAPGVSYLLLAQQLREGLESGLLNRADERLEVELRALHATLTGALTVPAAR